MTILDALEEYKKNIIEYDDLTKTLYNEENKDKWILALHKRAERTADLFKRNNELIDFILKSIDSANEIELNDAFDAVYALYQDGFDDATVMIPILRRLEDHYMSVEN